MKKFIAGAIAGASLLSAFCAVSAVPVTINYTDGAGVGFNDATLGAARKAAFEFGVDYYADRIVGTQTIVINASFPNLGGNAFGALLGQAGYLSSASGFANQPVANTFYPMPLANQLAVSDLDPGNPDLVAQFNADVDNPVVLGAIDFYYGLDGLPTGGDVDFVSVVLHEIGHGLGFAGDSTTPTGAINVLPDIFQTQLTVPGTGDFIAITNGQRQSAIVGSNLFWKGANVVAAKSGNVEMFAPAGFLPGSSFAHWDTTNSPDLLMEPFDTGPKTNIDITKEAFQDMGYVFGPAAAVRDWSMY